MCLILACVRTWHTCIRGTNNNTDKTEYVALNFDYYFNKNMVADVGYKINLLDGKNDDNQVVAGPDLPVLSFCDD